MWVDEKVNKRMKNLVNQCLPVLESHLSSSESGEMGGTEGGRGVTVRVALGVALRVYGVTMRVYGGDRVAGG